MIHSNFFTCKALLTKLVNISTSNTNDAFLQIAMNKISSDTSPFFLSVITRPYDAPPLPNNVDCNVLLIAVKFKVGDQSLT